jgi:Uma2 family endonuclease
MFAGTNPDQNNVYLTKGSVKMDYLVKTNSIGGLTEEQFFNFCQENDMLRMERNANGEIIIMSPTGIVTSWYNSEINTELNNWNRKQKRKGIVLDSNGGVTLPNNAVRSADAAYISPEQWEALTPYDRKRFAHVCPVFIIELLSESDDLKSLQDKMKEYIENGCKLAWLIDPRKRNTTVYRPDKTTEAIAFSLELSGEDVLLGFTINLEEIFTEG